MPRKAVTSEAKRFALNMKTTGEIRHRLERAAEASGRSLTHEVEYRLEQSFQEGDLLKRYFGSDAAIELLKELSLVINYHLERSGKHWRTDKATRDAIRAHFDKVFAAFDDENVANLQTSREENEQSLKNSQREPASLESSSLPNLIQELGILSSQEALVLQYLLSGASNKEIARELELPDTAIKDLVKGLLRKIRVPNRTQAIKWARQYLEPTTNEETNLPSGKY